MQTEPSQIVTAITAAALIGGIIYARAKSYTFVQTFGIAVVFGAAAYLGSTFLEEQMK